MEKKRGLNLMTKKLLKILAMLAFLITCPLMADDKAVSAQENNTAAVKKPLLQADEAADEETEDGDTADAGKEVKKTELPSSDMSKVEVK
jgi:hypothetical protein